MDLDGKRGGEDLEGVAGRKTIIRIYFIRNIFLIKGKLKKELLRDINVWSNNLQMMISP